jgi:hypothetical protein
MTKQQIRDKRRLMRRSEGKKRWYMYGWQNQKRKIMMTWTDERGIGQWLVCMGDWLVVRRTRTEGSKKRNTSRYIA